MEKRKIFVQIASYRDPELIHTLRHCLEKAKHPENLSFSICWQHDEKESLEEFSKDSRFNILDFDYKESKGACWARNKTQKFWKNEEFSLQLDSHIRFIKDWDEILIKSWDSLDDKKAIITGYPPSYIPGAPESDWYHVPQICNVYKFDHKYSLSRPMNLEGWENKTKPVKGVHISAGFVFGPGEINSKVPYDPNFYFAGEETAMAIRYFTHGYNIYNSHKVIVYHFYQRLKNPKHWDDNSNWPSFDRIAHDRLDCLLQRNNNYLLGEYGLGTERTLADYKNYAGIDFAEHVVHKETEEGKEPPCSNSAEGWDNEKIIFNSSICWDFEKIEKLNSPRFWAMIILDQDGVAIHREDLPYSDNKDLLDGKISCKNFKFERSKNRQLPKQLLIWPYCNEKLEWKTQSYFNI